MAKAGLVGRLAAITANLGRGRQRARIVHTYHGHVLDGYFSPLKTSLFIMLERLLARGTDAIVAISPAIRAELLERLPDRRRRAIPRRSARFRSLGIPGDR